MSFGQPSAFGVLNNSQSAPNNAFSRSNSIAQSAPNAAFSRSGSIAAPQGPAEVVMGDEVQESESDLIGYVALAGELRVKVFDGQYPESDLPIHSSQLLAISQKRQLFAAGGPQGVVVALTSTMRAAFKNTSAANGNTLPFQPECIIPMSLRLSHIAFTSDGTYLLLAAQLGGIAVYLVDDILSKGNDVQPQSQINTGPLLEMKPIPTITDSEKVCIVVGSGWGQGGNVGIIDLKTAKVQENLKTGVTTVSWSPKGKQIICGGSLGGLAWIRPADGAEADAVEGVPNYPNHFVSSIFWIESTIIFVILTPKPQPGQPHDNESIHFVLMREPQTRKHTFYRVNDMTPPFGMVSRPTYHSFIHLKAWSPNMKDCLVLSNTCSTDIGTVVRLNNTPFTPTSIMSDGRRATLPLTADGVDATPIGFSLDLTATNAERVSNPFPNVEQSATSLPCMWILTNDGMVSAYWVVYSDAVKIDNSSAAYPELLAYENQQPPQTPQRTTGPTFGQSGFGQSQTSAFGTPKPAFGQPSTPTSTFGQPSKPLAFGQTSAPTSAFGQTSQPTSAFGQPSTGTSAFGQPSQPSSAFGQPSQPTSGFGQRSQPASAFGQSSTPQPVFGQSSAPQSAFGQTPTPFGQAAVKPAFGQPAFGSTSTLGRPGMTAGAFGSSTGSTFGSGSAFGAQSGTSAFGQKPAAPAFGSTSTLGSTAPAFGSPTPLGSTAPAFGSTTGLGQPRPAFGQSAFGSSGSGTGFGQTSQLGSKLSAFGSSTTASTGGFAKFSGGGGFGTGNANASASPAFLQQSGSSNPFASKEPDTFGTLKNNAPVSAFGSGGQSGFAVSSTFGSTATPDTSKPSGAGTGTGAFGAFGNSLGSALSQPAASTNVKDDEMADSDDEVEQPREAFGQSSQSSAEPSKPSAFGSGLFGSTLNKEQPKGAFGLPNKPTALAPAFGTPESKPSAPVSAFGPTSPVKSSGQVGTGLFGSALQRSTSGAQPVSAFGSTTGPSVSKPALAFGTTPTSPPAKIASAFSAATTSTTSAFSKPAAPSSAFATSASSPTKPTVSAFGQKSTPPASSPKKADVENEVGAAATKGLPGEDSDEDTDHSPQEPEAAPLPPDFAPTAEKSKPVVPEDAPLPPDFSSTKAGAIDSSPIKAPLPESAPRTPVLPSIPPTPAEPAEKPVESIPIVKGKSPLKSDILGSASPSQPLASTSKPTKATNPMANRRGSKPTATISTKPTLSGRTLSQKAGATAKGAKLVAKDHDEDDSGSTMLGSFFPGSSAKTVGPQKDGESVLTLGTSTKSIGAGFSFGESKLDHVSDDSEEDDDDTSDAGSDENINPAGPESGEHSGQSSELEDGSWVETGDTEDEGSPAQPPVPAKDVKTAPRRDILSRITSPPTVKTLAGTPKHTLATTSKAGDMSRILNKAPLKSPESSKATSSLASALSPISAKLQQQEAADREQLLNKQNQMDLERDQRRLDMYERHQLALRELEQLKALRELQREEDDRLGKLEENMKAREDEFREKLKSPYDPCPVLSLFIPYRESDNLTHFKGQDAVIEQLVIDLGRRTDNFGLNMRNLEAFIVYHRKSDHFTLDDSRPVEEIRITAAPDVSLMARDLIEKVHDLEKTFDLATLKTDVTSLIHDVDYLVARASDIPNILLLHTHPELRAHIRRRPLSAQQRMQQANLRRKVPIIRRKFKRVEDAFRILQAHVATLNKNQRANYGDLRPPTIEQVHETVARLTEVAKEKAERVDKLEDSLRKMRLSSASPAMSRGTTPSFRAGSISFSMSGRDFERGGTPGWSKSTRKSRESVLATPPRNMPGPDKLDYYETTIDSPISRFSYGRQAHQKPVKSISGTFGLIEEELGDNEYFNDQNPSSSMGVPIATSYDRGMAELRKEILTTPKKGDVTGELPNTPASRQVNRLLKDEVEEMTGGRGRKAWIDVDDYLEDRKLKREVGKRMTKVIRKIGVKTTRVELA
ncbi:uncharacterized protein DFL_002033 [Arthrobotrys flagrans]|uniref:Nucleoporin Nup159/Nup146 N-terminal domain-containing protein n=1 Tax=Arthrobotrys flagrans TaxID=97331 RepID=A0A437A9C7_ARTFL|nr:hypothetical protein DFL_002033 [Arthrobotrys flagrans]